MKATIHFSILVLIFNITLIALPIQSHAGWFSWLNPGNWFNYSTYPVDSKAFNLIHAIKDINKKSTNKVNEENKTCTTQNVHNNKDNDEKRIFYDQNEEKKPSTESVNTINENIESLNKVLNHILEPPRPCIGYAYKMKRYFGFRNDLESSNEEGETALIAAAQVGSAQVVATLLLQGVTIDDQDSTGNSALMWAIQKAGSNQKYLNLIRQLLEKNADIRLKNKNNDTALTLALKFYKNRPNDISWSIVKEVLKTVRNKKLNSNIEINGEVMPVGSWIFDNIPHPKRTELLDFLNDNEGHAFASPVASFFNFADTESMTEATSTYQYETYVDIRSTAVEDLGMTKQEAINWASSIVSASDFDVQAAFAIEIPQRLKRLSTYYNKADVKDAIRRIMNDPDIKTSTTRSIIFTDIATVLQNNDTLSEKHHNDSVKKLKSLQQAETLATSFTLRQCENFKKVYETLSQKILKKDAPETLTPSEIFNYARRIATDPDHLAYYNFLNGYNLHCQRPNISSKYAAELALDTLETISTICHPSVGTSSYPISSITPVLIKSALKKALDPNKPNYYLDLAKKLFNHSHLAISPLNQSVDQLQELDAISDDLYKSKIAQKKIENVTSLIGRMRSILNTIISQEKNREGNRDRLCQLLNILTVSSVRDIEIAYRKFSLQYHPDKIQNRDDLTAEEKELRSRTYLEVSTLWNQTKQTTLDQID